MEDLKLRQLRFALISGIIFRITSYNVCYTKLLRVSAEKFIETATREGANIIACSALLTTTMTQMESIVKAADDAGIRDKITIMVGGAPVRNNFV